MAQRKRIGPITQGSVDRNYLPLHFCFCDGNLFLHSTSVPRNNSDNYRNLHRSWSSVKMNAIRIIFRPFKEFLDAF